MVYEPQKEWIAFGDIHSNTSQLKRIRGLREADGILISGDLTNCGNKEDGETVLAQIRNYNPHILAQIGNMDTKSIEDLLDSSKINTHRKIIPLYDDVTLVGLGYSNITPFHTPSEVTEEIFTTWLKEIEKKLNTFSRIIFLSHTPPFQTKTDTIANGMHVGSTAVRDWIEHIQPEICIVGHIHESIATDKIGKTKIYNPGDLASGGFVRLQITKDNIQAKIENTRDLQ